MRTSPFLPVILFLALVAEGAFLYGPHPDLKLDVVWLAVLFLGFYEPLIPGGFIVLLLGGVQETLGAPVRGVLPTAYLAIYFFLRLTHQNLFFQKRMSLVIWTIVLSLAFRGIEAGLLVWQDYSVPTGIGRLAAWALLEGLASLVFFPLFRLGARAPETLSPSQRKKFTL